MTHGYGDMSMMSKPYAKEDHTITPVTSTKPTSCEWGRDAKSRDCLMRSYIRAEITKNMTKPTNHNRGLGHGNEIT